MAQSGPQEKEFATASDTYNNCGFHCIIHTWLALPDAKLRELFDNNESGVYNALMMRFYEKYGIDRPHDFATFIKILRSIPHPHDRETLLGPIFRETLREDEGFNLTPQEKTELEDSGLASDGALTKLANAMGADISILPDQPDILDEERYTVKAEGGGTWMIKIMHSREEKHFNFSFANPADPAKNVAHNKNMALPDSLFDASSGIDAIAVKLRVHIANTRKKVSLGSLIQHPQQEASLTAKRVSQGADDKKADEIQRRPPVDPKIIKDAFMKYLEKAFPVQAWEYDNSPKAIKLTNIKDRAQEINIKISPDEMQFTASPGGIGDIAKAANAYHQALHDNGEEIEYEIQANTKDEAIEFLTQLKGLDLKAISTIRFDGQVLKGKEALEWVKKYAEDPTSEPTSKNKPF